jgi:hypothetical protein
VPPGSVTPASGPPDTPFSFTAAGFAPGENVFYWAEQPDGTPVVASEEVQANAEGVITWRWDAPFDSPPGEWTMVTRGRLDGLRVRIPFVVTPGEPRPDYTGVEPRTGTPGMRFVFTAQGYNPSEEVDVWIETPDGEPQPQWADELRGKSANGRGVARFGWTAPEDVPAGQYQIVIRGFDSRVTNVLSFRIIRGAPSDTARSGVTPYRGPPGTTFTFFGVFDGAHVGVSYWLTTPNRTIIIPGGGNLAETFTDDSGRATVQWTAPADAQRGTWNLTLQTSNPEELDDAITYEINFIIE